MIFFNLPIRLFLFTGFILPLLLQGRGAYAQAAPAGDSVTVAIAPEYNRVSKVHRVFFGENYRRLWATPVTLRVLWLAKEKGGLTITERGGGQQTKSLRLRDSSGQEWVLRSVQKNPEQALPANLRPTVAKDILQDLISTSHPFGALTVPPLAEALAIPHTNPEMVFMADDPALGEHRKDFARTVLLLEEREPLEAPETDNTEKVLKNLEKDADTRISQRLVLQARLLDMVIGDWDRHDDQWRWVEIKEEDGGTTYRPFPRDRDQVFYNADGAFHAVASRKWLLPKFQGFRKKIRDVNGFNFNARYFDRSFLNGLNQSDWEAAVTRVQQRLTDSVLAAGVRRLPPPIFALTGTGILEKLKARRNGLREEALTYFRFLSRTVDVPGPDADERFVVEAAGSGAVTVQRRVRGDTGDSVYYRRIFYPHITKEIRLYGRGGADVFAVGGDGKSPIKIRLVGGGGPDSFLVDKGFRNRGRLYGYDQSDEPNFYAGKGRWRLSADSAVNRYDRKEFRYDKLAPRVYIGYNLDDGLMLGGGLLMEKHSFRKEPFAVRHRLLMGRSLSTSAFFGTYQGIWKQLGGSKTDGSILLDARAPNNTSNFFGLGNETPFLKETQRRIVYYRTRYNLVTAELKLHRPAGRYGTFSGGLTGQFYNNNRKRNEGRFITLYDASRPGEAVFSQKYFAGFIAGAEWDSRNNHWWPSKGFSWNTQVTGMQGLNGHKDRFGQLRSELVFYLSAGKDTGFVLANRVGGGTTVGRPAFFQHLFLGGSQNLRGFRNFRFAGTSAFYHNIEARLRLFHFTSYFFPGTAGLTFFNDAGRVWAPGQESGKWHNGAGGGIYIIPARLVLIQASVAFSEEGALPYASVGFRF